MFLINPAGFVFGSTSGLNVNGSIHISTADFLELGLSTGRYYANPVAPLVLSSDAPSAFGFLNPNPASISITGNPLAPIASPTGMVSLVGGDITIQNTSAQGTVAGARVNIVSVDSAGVVVPGVDDIDVSSFTSMGNISLNSSAMIVTAEMGQVFIRGGNFTLDNSSKVVSATTSPAGGGTLDIALTGDLLIDNGASIVSTTSSAGNGASISVSGVNLTLDHGGQISTLTTGSGDAGNIVSDFSETTLIQNPKAVPLTEQDFSGFFSITQTSNGDAGDIQIDSAILNMLNGGTISDLSLGAGNGGNVTVTGATSISLGGIYNNLPGSIIFGPGLINKPTNILVGSVFSGQSGQLSLTAPLLSMNLQSEIQGLTANLGTGNSMQIDADVLNVDTAAKLASYSTGSKAGNSIGVTSVTLNVDNGGQIVTTATSSGNGGGIDVNATAMNLSNTATIASSNTAGGAGGSISIDATDLMLDDGGKVFAQTSSSGTPANVDLNIPGTLTIQDHPAGLTGDTDFSGVYVRYTNTASSSTTGRIQITGGDIDISQGGRIVALTQGSKLGAPITLTLDGNLNMQLNTEAYPGIIGSFALAYGDGGDINIQADGDISLSDYSTIATDVGLISSVHPHCDSGDINITADEFSIQNFSALYGNYSGWEQGGSIGIDVRTLDVGGSSRINTNINYWSLAGDININASESVLVRDPGTQIDARITFNYGSSSGTINITTPELRISNAGQIINGSYDSNGLGGDVNITVTDLICEGGGNINMGLQRSDAPGGTLRITADTILFDGIYRIPVGTHSEIGDFAPSGIQNYVIDWSYLHYPSHDSHLADAGPTIIQTRTLELRNGGGISASTVGDGDAGPITITASEWIKIHGVGQFSDWGKDFVVNSAIHSVAEDEGSGGNISITTPQLSLWDGGVIISTAGLRGGLWIYNQLHPDTGDPLVHGGNCLGLPGTVTIVADTIDLQSGGYISTEFGPYSLVPHGSPDRSQYPPDTLIPGEMKIIVSDAITISGKTDLSYFETDPEQHSGISTRTFSQGNAGNLYINCPVIEIENEGMINVSSALQPAGLEHTPPVLAQPGNAGYLEIKGNTDLSIASGGYINSSTETSGNAGLIDINMAGSLSIDGANSVINASTSGSGNSDGIRLTAANVEMTNGGSINSSTSNSGNAGNLALTVSNLFVLDGSGSGINSSTNGSGTAGHIEITADSLQLSDGASVNSSTSGDESAGEIKLTIAESIAMSGLGTIINNSTSGSGDGGILTISTKNLDIGSGSSLNSSSSGSGDGQIINITANRISISGSGSEVNSSTSGAGAAGSVNIDSDSLELFEGGRINSSTSGSKRAGSVTINSSTLAIRGNSEITSSTSGAGDGGERIDIQLDTLTIDGAGSRISNSASSSGNAGSVEITASQVTLSNGGGINASTSSTGNAGTVTISSSDLVLTNNSSINSSTTGGGKAGNITIRSESVEILENSEVTSSTNGSGHGGDMIDIQADSIRIAGSGSTLSNYAGNSGNAGGISVKGKDVVLEDGAEINVATTASGDAGSVSLESTDLEINGGTITSSTTSSGNAGEIRIDSLNLDLLRGTITSSTSSIGAAGSIDLQSSILNITDGTRITAESSGKGKGGDIFATAVNLLVSGSRISAEGTGTGDSGLITLNCSVLDMKSGSEFSATSFGSGMAGDITINAQDRINIENSRIITKVDNQLDATQNDGGNINITTSYMLKMINSLISGEVTGGKGNGGNITIDPIYVVLINSSLIANAYGGSGGNITIICDMFLNDVLSLISASSELGIDGEIEISAPQVDISGSMAALPETMAEISGLLPKQCSARSDDDKSSFQISSGEKLPPHPDGLMTSP